MYLWLMKLCISFKCYSGDTHTHTTLFYTLQKVLLEVHSGIETHSPASVISVNTLVLLQDTSFINNWWLRKPEGGFDWHEVMSMRAHMLCYTHAHTPAGTHTKQHSHVRADEAPLKCQCRWVCNQQERAAQETIRHKHQHTKKQLTAT